ncbi:MarR family winged helix-turn-helix transcriptional regulator [Thiohalorhabdus methylotrophus]|uniref:MarR family winged helix-turn-helix transcriptional regulator n=1 Tax=Thiohalorhabdus methylotrophus TaxID=3242694 RepID=A0ABV4TRX0_9GAMM
MLWLRDLPKYETLQKFASRYPGMDISAVESFLTLLRVASDLFDGLDACLARHDLQQGRWWVLVLLMRRGNLTAAPSELAEQAGVTRATMTGLVDSLERAELVERIPDPRDRRSTQVRMTSAGKELMDVVMPDYYRRVAALFTDLETEERQRLVADLEAIQSRVAMLGAETAP